ncbi:hybrid sensor histidine kinase/response regulator [Undibacterium sp. SXout7W]|uniref:ATP-binding response regulator n=1 Tax=Undibacterium sp. SXout7W TaxID=3413049 RepID=UPI003BF0EE3B
MTEHFGKAGTDRSLAGKKIRVWALLRRTIEIAIAVDVLFFVLFYVLGSPIMAWVNVLSVMLYAIAYALLMRRHNQLAVILVWTEVLSHAVLGSMMLGWDSGFHYYLLMFVPTLFLSTTSRLRAFSITALFWAFYLCLDFAAHSFVSLEYINPFALLILRYINFSIVFAMFANLSYFFLRELARAKEMQEEQHSELTRFLAVASHDLRQPMHALNLYLGALTMFELPESARPVLANVSQCAHIMEDMFLALLDLSRLDAQVVQPQIERFPMTPLLSQLEVEFAPQAKAKGIELHILPATAWVETDLSIAEQILRNLVSNAVRYTNAGNVTVSCSERGDKLRVSVQDTGIGISLQQQTTIFDEFSQLNNSCRDRSKGIGLGLAIVKRLSRLLGTSVTLVSLVGEGSRFSIDFPLTASRSLESLPESTSVADGPSFQNKMVVVIDDEVSILDAMRILIEQWGCIVMTATSGEEALRKLGGIRRLPDLLICDYQLHHNENGLDVIQMLRDEFNHDISALMITGDTTQERIQEIQATGLPVLYKPVNAVALLVALNQLLQ